MHSLFAALLIALLAGPSSISLEAIGRYEAGVFDDAAAEIVAFDPGSQRLFVVNGADQTIDVLDISDPSDPWRVAAFDVTPFGASPNSVAVKGGVVAVAVEADPPQDPGRVVFFDSNGDVLSHVVVGALPDMVTFTPDGHSVLVANEGEPNDSYLDDPEGTISLIDISAGASAVSQSDVTTIDFQAFNGMPLDPSVRVYGPGASVAQDLEPEFIAVSEDSRTAWVTLQENNAVAIVDLKDAEVIELVGLGSKDHRRWRNALDASNEDGRINIRRWPVRGFYQPDAIASFQFGHETFLITANEGDARDYGGFSEETRVEDLALDTHRFPNAASLQRPDRLGRLKTTTVDGDLDGDGDNEAIFSFGARSFSIWTSDMVRVFDSGSQLERITAAALPNDFNSDNDANGSFEARSDDKGPEPEGVAVGLVDGRTYAFVGLERIGGIVVYDVSFPLFPRFIQYVNERDFAGDAAAGMAGDLGPEGILFVPASESPSHEPLLVVANEVSGTTTIYRIVVN